MMTRKNTVIMRELNDTTDHNNVAIIRMFADEMKYFSLKSIHKRRRCFNSFDTRVYF